MYLSLLIFLLEILTPACALSSPAFCMMYSAYKWNKQGDIIQPWCSPFPIRNQTILLWSVLTVVSWSAYNFLRRQVRCSGLPISLKIFHNLLWSTQSKALTLKKKKKKKQDIFSWNYCTFSMIQQMLAILSLVPLPFLNTAWASWIHCSCTIEAWLGEFWALPY